jgi:DUF971 family protein
VRIEAVAETPALRSLRTDGNTLIVEWADGVTHRLRWELLRKACPCATCRAERNQSKPDKTPQLLPILKPEEARPLTVAAMHPVGNYAYAIHFTDGHNTGIYSLEYLRALGEAAVDASAN